jgi:hypothetical protein
VEIIPEDCIGSCLPARRVRSSISGQKNKALRFFLWVMRKNEWVIQVRLLISAHDLEGCGRSDPRPAGFYPTILQAVDDWDQKGDIFRSRSMMGGSLSMIRSISASVL